MSKRKKIVILLVTCCFILGVMSPAINSLSIKNNNKSIKDDYNKTDTDYKKTDYDSVIAHASFYWDPKYPDPGEKITFYSNSYASGGYITSEKWKFDNGHTDIGHKTSAMYEKKGSYKVTLYVSAFGYEGGYSTDSETRYVKVGADPFPKITCTPENPSPGEEVKLDASESSDPDGRITSYNWSYYDVKYPGDVTDLGTEKVVYHTWDEQGIYNVSLFVEDDKGNNNTIEKTIHVSILKLGGFANHSKGLSFKISNHGNITANNVKWNLEIYKYFRLNIRTKCLHQKSGTISFLSPENSQTIEIKDLRRKFCKINLTVTAEADNAVRVSKSFYGLIFGKHIFLSEEDFVNPYGMLVIAGLGMALIAFIMYAWAKIG